MYNPKKVLLIINPKSGRGKGKTVLLKIVDIFTQNGKLVTVYPTVGKKQTVEFVSYNAKDYDLVVACGGDGTLNEVVNGVMHSRVRIPVGYIPLGSTNDFASSVGIPDDCFMAVEKILNGTPKPYDLGLMADTYFTYIACAGAFVETSYTTSQNLKNALGHSAYLLSGIKSLSSLKQIPMRITTNSYSIYGEFLFVSLTNSKRIAGLVNFPEEKVEFSDGLFELSVITMPKDMFEVTTLIRDLLAGNLNNHNIVIKRVKSCDILIPEKIGWSVDGEDGGMKAKVKLEVIKRAIDIVL